MEESEGDLQAASQEREVIMLGEIVRKAVVCSRTVRVLFMVRCTECDNGCGALRTLTSGWWVG